MLLASTFSKAKAWKQGQETTWLQQPKPQTVQGSLAVFQDRSQSDAGGPCKSTWALPWTHLWPFFKQRHCIKILAALTPVPTTSCFPLQSWQARIASGYRRWQQMKNPNPMRYISGLFLIYNFFACHCCFSLPHWNHRSNCNITSSAMFLARTLFSMSDYTLFKQKVLCETNRREIFVSGMECW